MIQSREKQTNPSYRTTRADRPGLKARLLLVSMAILLSFVLIPGTESLAKPMGAKASEVIGRVVLVSKKGARQDVKVGDNIPANHVLITGPGAKAGLTLDDGSRVEVFESSRVEVNALLPEEKSKFSVSLFFGRVAAKLKRLRGDDVVITPTMVAGVRGTDFTVCVTEDGTSVVSVTKGQVAVSTDKAWDQTESVMVEPGQEVLADTAGATLIPRPIQLETLEDFKAFRQAKLEAMKADLPKIIADMEMGVDPNLQILDKISALPQDRAAVLKKLDEKLKELKPHDVAERAKLIIQTHMEASNMLSLVKRFRIQRMRLKSTFEQSERLKSLLPTFAEELGPEYKSVDEGLARILARQKEVDEKEQEIGAEFSASVGSAQPLIEKFQKPQFNLKTGQ